MPRKPGAVNKSAAIRDILTSNPGVKAKDAVSSLAQQDIKITPGLFYFIKGKMKAKTQRRKRVVRAARAASANGDPVTLIREVKALSGRAGGIDKLKELVQFEIARARDLYRQASEAIPWLADDGSRVFAALIITTGTNMLDAMQKRWRDLLTRPPRVTTARMLGQLPRAWRMARRSPMI